MSVEWYLQAYTNGNKQPVPTKNVTSVFSSYVTQKSDRHIDVALPEGDVTIYIDSFSNEIFGMTISRPINSRVLDRIIYEIMQYGNFIFFAVDGRFPIVLNSKVPNHLPDGIIELLGEPQVAENLDAFFHLLKEIYKQ